MLFIRYMHTYVHIHIYTHIHTYIYTRKRTYLSQQPLVRAKISKTLTLRCSSLDTYIHTYIHIYTHIHTYINTHRRAYPSQQPLARAKISKTPTLRCSLISCRSCFRYWSAGHWASRFCLYVCVFEREWVRERESMCMCMCMWVCCDVDMISFKLVPELFSILVGRALSK